MLTPLKDAKELDAKVDTLDITPKLMLHQWIY